MRMYDSMCPRIQRLRIREPWAVEEQVLVMSKNMRVFCIETMRAFTDFKELAIHMEEVKPYFLVYTWMLAIK